MTLTGHLGGTVQMFVQMSVQMSVLYPLGLGVLGGCGVAAIVTGLFWRREGLDLALVGLATPRWPTATPDEPTGVVSAIATRLAYPAGAGVAADLAVIDRTPEAHAVDKLRTCLFYGLLPVVIGAASVALGLDWSPPVFGLGTIILGAGGWFLADHQLRSRAALRRREFRSTLVSYVQLVTIMLAGGAGVNQALAEAAQYGRGWSFSIVQHALRDSSTRGISPWEGLGRVADEMRLDDLTELAAAMRLAGESGAHVRRSLLAKAESLRVHELAEIEAEAAASSEKMGGPVGGMVVGFVITMGYPAFAAILQI